MSSSSCCCRVCALCGPEFKIMGLYNRFFKRFFAAVIIRLTAQSDSRAHFLSRCKFSILLTFRQSIVEFSLLTLSRFPLRYQSKGCCPVENQTHDSAQVTLRGLRLFNAVYYPTRAKSPLLVLVRVLPVEKIVTILCPYCCTGSL